jgi:hypothetical protein
MGVWNKTVRRAAWSAVIACAITGGASAAAQGTATPVPAASVQATETGQAELPDSPGATLARLQQPAQTQGSSNPWPAAAASPQAQDQEPQAPPVQSGPSQAQPPQKPVGTAAAESTHAAGVAASQPAGVAIAPTKQRRVRTIVIRTAALLGAGAAVGSVVALTAATSSKPPGAH